MAMAGDKQGRIVRPLNWARLRAGDAEKIVRARTAITKNIAIGVHAFERIQGRSILAPDVYRILRAGSIEGEPEMVTGEDGVVEWKVVMVRRMAGTRDAGAVTLFVRDDEELFVKTVMWMDCKR